MLSVEDVNWEDPAVKRWLDTITKRGTRYNYKSAFRAYHMHTGMSASALVDEAFEDSRRDPREKRDIVVLRLIKFYDWLKTEYPVKARGKGPHDVVRKGVSDKLAHMYVAALRSFYATFGITVRMKGRRALPRPRVKNKRMKISAEQVKILVDHARTPRDRAIILTLFQSGMDISTLCALKYGDVAEGLAKGEHPLKLDLFRQKTGVDFYTFLGRDAIQALKAYLADMRSRGVQFRRDTTLFLKERGKEAMTTNLAQNMMRELASKAGFVGEEDKAYDQNPLGPHALRESFGSIMINSGVPDTIVDFWLGHAIGEMAEAYKSVQAPALKKMYLDREHFLSISQASGLEEVRTEVKSLVADLTIDNKRLKEEMEIMKTQNLELRSEISRIMLEADKKEERLRKGEAERVQIERKLEDIKMDIQRLMLERQMEKR